MSFSRAVKAALAAGIATTALIALSFSSAPAAFAACDSGSTGGLSLSANDCTPVKKARIVNGKAIAPASAPARVKKVIAAANKIRNKPYIYGGGHGRLNDRGYDCSGSVSYALRAGGFVKSSMPSGGYIRWKRKGLGRWITTYANGGHMYMVVAGVSFDTSNMGGKVGNRWSTTIRSSKGFSARHPGNY